MATSLITPTTNILLRFSYPKVPGDQPWSIIDVRGPVAYQPLVAGTPATGGQRITARDFGLQALDFVAAMGTSNGMNILVIPEQLALQSEFEAIRIGWMQLTGGQASGNLSTFLARLLAIGRF